MTYRVPKGQGLRTLLLAERQLRQMTQEEMAELIGVPREQYNKWEGGNRGIQGDNVVKVSRALGLEISTLEQVADPVVALRNELDQLRARVARLEKDLQAQSQPLQARRAQRRER